MEPVSALIAGARSLLDSMKTMSPSRSRPKSVSAGSCGTCTEPDDGAPMKTAQMRANAIFETPNLEGQTAALAIDVANIFVFILYGFGPAEFPEFG
jgi:hypothetical protein